MGRQVRRTPRGLPEAPGPRPANGQHQRCRRQRSAAGQRQRCRVADDAANPEGSAAAEVLDDEVDRIDAGHEAGTQRERGEFAEANIKWTAAHTAAAALGAGWHLATITTAAEEDFVRALPATLPDRSHVWLGASDAASEGSWSWVTGEAWSYTHWWPGEPNDNGGVEEFLALDLRGTGGMAWNDVSDNIDGRGWARGYIAERAAVPLPATLPLVALGVVLAARRRRTDGELRPVDRRAQQPSGLAR